MELRRRIKFLCWLGKKYVDPSSRGAGLCNWQKMNEAMGEKFVWDIYKNTQQLWVQILQAKYLDQLDDCKIFTIAYPLCGSAIWKFLVSCRKVITDHLSWQIGDGRIDHFWLDSWDGQQVLNSNENVMVARRLMEESWGTKVRDYLEPKRDHGRTEWGWKLIREVLQNSDYIRIMEDIFKNKKVHIWWKRCSKMVWRETW